MNQAHQLQDELNQLQILETITSVYGQIASMWMMRTRDSIVESRQFLDEMQQVFLTTFASYANQVQALARKKKVKKGEKITFLAHNGKKVAVFLAANAGFYGDIVKETFNVFLQDIEKEPFEVTIVGRQGLNMFMIEKPNQPYTFFDIPDGKVDQSQLQALARHLVQYEEIRVYYGKFQSFLSQSPVVFRLSANPYENLSQQEKAKKYLFEPDLQTILMFFEKQIFSSVFEQTIRESQLAKFASRIMVMDRATEKIKYQLKRTQRQALRSHHREANRKQLGMFASMPLWGQHI